MTQLTLRELEIMAVLWERDSATVREVHETLDAELAYTTVLTMMRRLEAKGHIGRHPDGRAHRYFARVQRQQARRSALSRTLDHVFEGSREALLTQLVSDPDLTEEDIRRLRRLLDERLREEGGE